MSTSTLFALATTIVGGLNLVYAGWSLLRSWHARRWRAVDGELLSARLRKREQLLGQAAWKLQVEYRYYVGSQTYKGAVISPDGGPAFPTEQLGLIAIGRQWRPGTPVRVRVNPRHPE